MPLKVAVLVKQVPDHEALVRVESDQQLEIEDRYVCSFFDEIAMEAALAVKQANPDAELIGVAAGGRRAVDALRRAIAMGLDAIEHVEDEALDTADSLAVAEALAARLRQLEPQLVLCGKQAGDDDAGAVGPMVAELIGIPHACSAVSLEVDAAAGKAEVGRKVEGAIWRLEASLPLLVTAEKGLAEPHIPVVTKVMKAMRAKPNAVSPADLGLEVAAAGSRVERRRYLAPAARPPVKMLNDVGELVAALQQSGVLPS
jgi:electron transfer flavoprotein beta subunit